ncbi:penicillin acylase family protein [uncultured Imperialibacter sp.]|uniref:penicillin acylase family protein n=1 Tax=uncultured Imperialibacter sp. TaxID=1672639 RepID=UPI0030D80CA2|tara:strand:- start:9138 stop:11177 length:2040 start_codon:yes stop_codon:yes gene_type:complete
MRYIILLFLLAAAVAQAQIDPANITIARDTYGVPHIFAPTDPEVAYGLAWAHAEDDFETIQQVALISKGMLGSYLGKEGAKADYAFKLLRCRQLVEEQWSTISPELKALINGYIQGLKAYADAHPDEVLNKHVFPADEKDYLSAVVFSVAVFSGADRALSNLFAGKMPTLPGFDSRGSNAFAIHPSKTTTGEAFLAINAHQPQEGPVAFYEAHVQSEEGWNMLGGVFPGGCVIFHGTNENLGWAHTVNMFDKVDVFQLEMNPSNSNEYRFDDQWLKLEKQKVKLKVKGIPVRIGKKAYWSVYGPTVKADNGTFSVRMPALMDAKALEEWYRMNKARNFSEFYKALSMTSLPMFNIVYADRYDTIFYVSNGKLPRRNPDPQYDWSSTLPGNTSATLWTAFKGIEELPQYVNPGAGYLFNTNHAPFLATAPADNLDTANFDSNDGFFRRHNNRSKRVMEIMPEGKLDYDTFKQIKFDQQLPQELQYEINLDAFWNLDVGRYPELANVINSLQQWDRKATVDSRGAAVFLLMYYKLYSKYRNVTGFLPEEEAVATYQYVHDYMIEHFDSDTVALGDVQKLVRGGVAYPIWGLPDALTAIHSREQPDGTRKSVSGDAYIALVRYPKEGLPIIETVNTYGASMHPDSPHFKDQLERFQHQQPKHMTLDKDEVLRTAERVYHPVR